jgi:hypothetical protein
MTRSSPKKSAGAKHVGAKHVKRKRFDVNRPGAAATKRPCATRSKAAPKGGFLDPLPVLEQMNPYPISLLAVKAAHGGITSGSQAVPGGSTKDSDFDIYVPFAPPALQDIMHVLSFGEIRWDNVLSDRLEEVARSGTTIVPFKLILSLVEALSSVEPCPLDGLLEYLHARFRGAGLGSNSVDDFLTRFDHAVQDCRVKMRPKCMWYGLDESRGMMLRKIWVYEGVHTRVYVVPKTIKDTISGFSQILYECHQYYVEGNARHEQYAEALSGRLFDYGDDDEFDDSEDNEEEGDDKEDSILTPESQTSDEAASQQYDQEPKVDVVQKILDRWKYTCNYDPKKPKLNLKEIRRLWEEEGFHDDQMRGYIIDMLHQEVPFCSRAEIESLVDQVFHPQQRVCPKPLQTDKYHGPGFRILRGVRPDGKKIQVIFISPKSTGIRTVLNFYATHVMCFIGGTLGAHLYWRTAKEQIGETLDFRNDIRHPQAEKSILKWIDRSWEFRKISKKTELRHAMDKHSKMVDYESIYKTALQQMHGNDCIFPGWWKNLFGERKYAFSTYSWIQSRRRIIDVRNERKRLGDDNSEQFLDWIHTKLAGHPRVIPKDLWKKRDRAKVHLDLWFGGININPQWDNQKHPPHESWKERSWHNRSWLWKAWDLRYKLF